MEGQAGGFFRCTRGSGCHGWRQRARRECWRLTWRLTLALALGLSQGMADGAERETFSELEVRAVYLYNFAVFVDWPDIAFASPNAPIRFCVAGNRALVTNLEQVLWGEALAGRGLELMTAEDPERWESCHLLYVDHGFQHLMTPMLNRLRGKPVLTVGDSEDFTRRGGMIGLVRKGGRLRTLINREALAGGGIRVSAKLLRLSTLVTGGETPPAP